MRGRAAILFWQLALTAGGGTLGALLAVQASPGSERACIAAVLLIAAATVFIGRRWSRSVTQWRSLQIQLKLARVERDHAHAILSSISDAVLVTDPAGDVVLANDSASRTFDFNLPGSGISSDRTRGNAGRFLSDQKLAELIRDVRKSDSLGGRRVVEHQLWTPAGPKVFKVTLSCMNDGGPAGASGSYANSGVVAVLHDVTLEREAAEPKNHFVSSVSHELRTPLASIKAYTELLVDGEASDEQTRRRFYTVIQHETNRLTRLIDDILNISSIESGLVRVNRRPVNLTEVLNQAMEVIAPQAQIKHQELVSRLAPTVVSVTADKDMLHQAVLNLLSNAVKYTPPGGQITVETAFDASRRTVTTRICDTGVGIPPKELPRVFDKFYRVEANDHMAKGTGLGLSLVKQIVETVHGGRIFVESSVGTGSCFGFELDVCDSE